MTRADPTNTGRRRGRTTVLPPMLVRGLAVLLAGIALGGCYGARDTRDVRAPVPTDYRLRHPIAIQEGDRTLEVFVGRNRGGLTPSQRAEVLSFAQGWRHDATGGIVIDIPAGTPNERAAADTLPEIQSLVAAAGLPPNAVYVQPYQPGSPAKLATIRIRYPRMVAEAGPCGLWPDDIGPNVANPNYLANKQYFNLGCANQRNLAAVVENPADLVQPRGETPPYTARRTVVLDKYRKGETPNGKYDIDDKARISEVGK